MRPFLDALEKERKARGTKARAGKTRECPYCRGPSGWRYVNGFSSPVRGSSLALI